MASPNDCLQPHQDWLAHAPYIIVDHPHSHVNTQKVLAFNASCQHYMTSLALENTNRCKQSSWTQVMADYVPGLMRQVRRVTWKEMTDPGCTTASCMMTAPSHTMAEVN